MGRSFEKVHTMTDYYDGPRRGIADFDGAPHLYESCFGELGYDDIYELRPVDEETLQLALEDWQIWLRWEDAFRAGLATTESHPALAGDRPRHDALSTTLTDRLAALVTSLVSPRLARAAFRPRTGHRDGGGGRTLEVQWQPLD